MLYNVDMLTMKEHLKYQFLTNCPVCGHVYDAHWKIVNHIRKSQNEEHITFLRSQELEYFKIYLANDRQKLHESLFLAKNIFCGISFKNGCTILHKFMSKDELEFLRKSRISKTMAVYEKSEQHNKHVSESIAKAWADGKFSTSEVKKARQRGYNNRRSYAGSANPMYGKPSPKGSGRGRGGTRKDIGHYVRSTWEANLCRILQLMNREYSYEKFRCAFTMNDKNYTYSPDIYLPKTNRYYEIKGHAKSSSDWNCDCKNCLKTKYAINYLRGQNIKITVIGHKEYRQFKKIFMHKLPLWEK